MTTAALTDPHHGFRGTLILPADAHYEVARKVFDWMIDRRPTIIARCEGADDVKRAIRFGRDAGLLVAVRGGGHGVAGHCTCDRGLVIDLDRNCRAHTWRWHRLADAEVWAGLRQPDLGRPDYCRRSVRPRERRRGCRPLPGGPRRRWQLRRRHVVRVPTSHRRARARRNDSSSTGAGAGSGALLA